MAAKVRFQTSDKNIARLELFKQQGVLIECGGCGKCATIHRIETLDYSILRHENVNTTQRFYIKTASAVAVDAMKKLEEKISGTAVVQ